MQGNIVQHIANGYKNSEICQFENVSDDVKGWCLENPEDCVLGFDLEGKIYDNMMLLTSKAFDLYKLFNVDDSCFSDAEQVAEIYKFSSDIGEISAILFGFDLKWDKSIERKHIRRKDFIKELNEELKEIKIPGGNLFTAHCLELANMT